MNIYYLDDDPVLAARYHCNQHITIAPKNCAQILSNIHWCTGYTGTNHVDNGVGPYKKATRTPLDLMMWLMQSVENYRWAIRHGFALAAEYTRRYTKVHGSEIVLNWLREHEPDLPNVGRTVLNPTSLGEYRVPGDPVESYRRFYAGHKRDMKTWLAGERPPWFDSQMVQAILQYRDANKATGVAT